MCKLYLDLETEITAENPYLHIIDIHKVINIIKLTFPNVKIHVASANKVNVKCSYHIIVDVILHKKQMELFSKYINIQYGHKICDTGVYSSVHDFRLP